MSVDICNSGAEAHLFQAELLFGVCDEAPGSLDSQLGECGERVSFFELGLFGPLDLDL